MTEEEWMSVLQEALDDLERDGCAIKTGEFRNGKPVYVLTEKGKLEADADEHSDVLH